MLTGHRRLFVIVTPVIRTGDTDELMDLPLLCGGEGKETLGLPSILGKKLYVLPVVQQGRSLSLGKAEVQAGDLLLWVNWDIQFL